MSTRKPVALVVLRATGEWPHVPPGYGVDGAGYVTEHGGARMEFTGWEKARAWLENPGFGRCEPVQVAWLRLGPEGQAISVVPCPPWATGMCEGRE